MQKERHTEKPKYTEKEIKSTYDTKNKRQNSDKAYVKGVETKTHLTNKEKEKRTIKEKKEIK